MANTFKLGDNIKYFRKLRKMTQEELAEKSGLSTNFISMIERSKSAKISVDRLNQIANALGIDTYKLLLPDKLDSSTFLSPELTSLVELIQSFDNKQQTSIIVNIYNLIKSIQNKNLP